MPDSVDLPADASAYVMSDMGWDRSFEGLTD